MNLYDLDGKINRIMMWLQSSGITEAVTRPLIDAALLVRNSRVDSPASFEGLKNMVRYQINAAENEAADLSLDDWQAANDAITQFRVAMFTSKHNRSTYHLTHGKSVFHFMETNLFKEKAQ